MALLRNSTTPGTTEPAWVPISPCLRAESGDQAPLKPTAPPTVSFPPDSNAHIDAGAPREAGKQILSFPGMQAQQLRWPCIGISSMRTRLSWATSAKMLEAFSAIEMHPREGHMWYLGKQVWLLGSEDL